MPNPMPGVLTPVVTPYAADLSPDKARLLQHCKWLQDQGCGLAVFGTNSEGNSLSVEEKIDIVDYLIDGGIDPGQMMPGTGTCALTDTVKLTAHAVQRGCAGVLMLPPFYYKAVSDDGLFRSFAEVIDRVGAAGLDIYLYHFPQIAVVKFSIDLVGRLIEAYPDTVVGMKDSSGDWDYGKKVIETFPGWRYYAGSDSLLLETMRAGGAGCISATCNINPGPIARLWETWENAEADVQQAGLNAVRSLIAEHPMIPAMKYAIAHYSNDADWRRLRPPLVELDEAAGQDLVRKLDAIGFTMPGLTQAA